MKRKKCISAPSYYFQKRCYGRAKRWSSGDLNLGYSEQMITAIGAPEQGFADPLKRICNSMGKGVKEKQNLPVLRSAAGYVLSNMPGPDGLLEAVRNSISVAIFH